MQIEKKSLTRIPVIQRDLTMNKTVHYMEKPNSKIQINDESLLLTNQPNKANSKKIKVEVYQKGSGELLHADQNPIPYRESSRDVSNVGS